VFTHEVSIFFKWNECIRFAQESRFFGRIENRPYHKNNKIGHGQNIVNYIEVKKSSKRLCLCGCLFFLMEGMHPLRSSEVVGRRNRFQLQNPG
jgi:hypothetical protein